MQHGETGRSVVAHYAMERYCTVEAGDAQLDQHWYAEQTYNGRSRKNTGGKRDEVAKWSSGETKIDKKRTRETISETASA